MEEAPYTKLIKNKLLEKVESIPLSENGTTDFNNGENCFKLKVINILQSNDI